MNKNINGYYANYKNKNVFMPFGSMMNAYGQTMKPKNIKEFMSDCGVILEKAKEMVGKVYLETAQEIDDNKPADTPTPDYSTTTTSKPTEPTLPNY